ncbi:hypothetical protein JCM11491_002697 [Sporobolomyces phaffii]
MLPQLDLSTLTAPRSLDRKILCESDVDNWKRSLPFEAIQDYLAELADSSVSHAPAVPSPVVDRLCSFLDDVIDTVHARPGPRGGFAEFRAQLAKLATALHRDLLPTFVHADVVLPELTFHLLRAFGSVSRLDYGTGHELSFVLYLVALRLASILAADDSPAVVAHVWTRYWTATGLVRDQFQLDVAGRRGVWKRDAESGKLWFDPRASQLRGAHHHPSSSSSSGGRLRVSTTSDPLYLLRSLLAPPRFASSSASSPSPAESGRSSPNPLEPGRTSSPFSSSSSAAAAAGLHESRSDLMTLYLHSTLLSLPCLLHLRFGPLLPFATAHGGEPLASSADSNSNSKSSSRSNLVGEDDDALLEAVQNKREGSEGTVAPWNVPTLAGLEHDEQRGRGVVVGLEDRVAGLDLVGVGEGEGEGERGRGRKDGDGDERSTTTTCSSGAGLKRGKSRLSISELAE